ncbi:MAG TPA: hypothetical protein VF787_08575 [Thermoanaerobaculia bacterium]
MTLQQLDRSHLIRLGLMNLRDKRDSALKGDRVASVGAKQEQDEHDRDLHCAISNRTNAGNVARR